MWGREPHKKRPLSVCFFGLFEKAPPLERHQSSKSHKKRTSSSLKKVFDHHHHHQKQQQQQQHEEEDDDDDAIDDYDYGFGEARSCWCAFSFFSLFFLCRRREWIHTRSGRDVCSEPFYRVADRSWRRYVSSLIFLCYEHDSSSEQQQQQQQQQQQRAKDDDDQGGEGRGLVESFSSSSSSKWVRSSTPSTPI